MRQTYTPVAKVFVLDVAGRPTVAFEALSVGEARQLPREEWLQAEMLSLKNEDMPLWDCKATMHVRHAAPAESAAFVAASAGRTQHEEDECFLVYLVSIDESG